MRVPSILDLVHFSDGIGELDKDGVALRPVRMT